MFHVSLIMQDGRRIVWNGDAKTPAHAVKAAMATPVIPAGSAKNKEEPIEPLISEDR